jgi:hypothetical protein
MEETEEERDLRVSLDEYESMLNDIEEETRAE